MLNREERKRIRWAIRYLETGKNHYSCLLLKDGRHGLGLSCIDDAWLNELAESYATFYGFRMFGAWPGLTDADPLPEEECRSIRILMLSLFLAADGEL